MTKKIKFNGNTDNIVVLTVDDLDDLVYSASYRASNKAATSLYNGLDLAYMRRFNDDLREIREELEQLRLLINTKESVADDETSTAK